jgi:hypothetical protein
MDEEQLVSMMSDRNRQTRGNWDCFAQHRERIRSLLAENCSKQARSICILGAGNCNDLDLPWLVERFEKIALVDLDQHAMQNGVERQLTQVPEVVRLVASDVTGVFQMLGEGSPTDDRLRSARERLAMRPVATDLEGRYDCVLSTCLLSQLIDALKQQIGEQHPRFLPLVLAIRAQHLALMTQLVGSQGLVAVIVDFVSSLTCPDLDRVAEADLATYAAGQLARRNLIRSASKWSCRKWSAAFPP